MPEEAQLPSEVRGAVAAALELIDDCLERDTRIEVILTRTAEALGCAVGVEVSQGALYAAEPDGVLAAVAPPGPAVSRVLRDGSKVWIAGSRADLGPDMDRLLRRLGIAAKVAFRLADRAQDDDADVKVAVDPEVEEAARRRALERVGLGGSGPLTTFALYGDAESVAVFVDRVSARCAFARLAQLGPIYILLAKGLAELGGLGVPVGLRASYSAPVSAADLPEAWRHARLALRFARPSPRDSGVYVRDEAVLNDSSNTGGYLLLAEVLTVAQISQVPDVRRLNHLVREQGAEMLVCLEAVAATDSLRKAAALLHLHHNSVASRVERAERYLGFGLMEPYGRTRLFMALVLRRLLESGRLFGS